MGLYLGSKEVDIVLNGNIFYLNIFSETPITDGVLLKSSDGYILKDTNGAYIIAKEVS